MRYVYAWYKMEELYTIAVSFGKIVHNRGFSVLNQCTLFQFFFNFSIQKVYALADSCP